MSTEVTKEIICPQCGAGCKITLTPGINPVLNPEYKEKILNETLFDWVCPRCQYGAQMAYPLVYSDPSEGYVIALYRTGTSGNKVETPPQLDGVVKRRVKNLAELKEKILIFDNGLDDVAVELVKNALSNVIMKSYKTSKLKLYFSRICDDGGLEFAIFMPDKKEAVYHATKIEVYNQSAEVLRSLNFVESEGFMRVGPSLASDLLEEYKNI